MISKSVQAQLSKFLIIGVSNTLISYIVFIIVYSQLLVGDAFFSQSLSYAAGILWSFFWNKKWTFREKKHSWVKFFPFLTLQLILLLVSAFLLMIANDYLDWNINLIWICVMGVITIINFVFTKLLVFKV